MNLHKGNALQQPGPASLPATVSRSAAVLDRRSARLVDRARDAGVSITYLGIGALFAETRAYPGPDSDWVIGPVTSRSDAVVPRAERAALQRLLDAGIDFPMLYIAHEVQQGRLDIPAASGPGAAAATLDRAAAEAAVGPVPPPAAATALAGRMGRRAHQLLRVMGFALAGAGAVAAAPFVLAGAAVAAIGAVALDPIVFGVIPAGSPVPGESGAWFVLAQWEWPTPGTTAG